MSLLKIFDTFTEEQDKGKRAAFEAAMHEKITTSGYKMSELLYELFLAQEDIQYLKEQVTLLHKEKAPTRAKRSR